MLLPGPDAPGLDGTPGTAGRGCAGRSDGRDRAFLRLVADCSGQLRRARASRAQRRHRRCCRDRSVRGRHGAAIGLAATAWSPPTSAAPPGAGEDILGFMLGDLREKLATSAAGPDRAVDGKAIAYFATLEPRDPATVPWKNRRARSRHRQCGWTRQARRGDGCFREAYARSMRSTIASRQGPAPVRPRQGRVLIGWFCARDDSTMRRRGSRATAKQCAQAGAMDLAISIGIVKSPTATTTSPCAPGRGRNKEADRRCVPSWRVP